MNYYKIIIHYCLKAKCFLNIPSDKFPLSLTLIHIKMKTLLFWFHAFVTRVFMKQLTALYSPFKANKNYADEHLFI